MNPRLERKLRQLAIIVAASVTGSIAFTIARGFTSTLGIMVGVAYGLLISVAIGGVELFILQGPMRNWLASLPLTGLVLVRSAIYAVIIVPTQFFQLGALVLGQRIPYSTRSFWIAMVFSVVCLIVFNLALAIASLIGGRTFLNFISGRYHNPIQESRFVLFVDIAGSTGLAEKLGGVGFHRFLDRTFRVLNMAVEDYRGEVLDYVGDEIIVTWTERLGAVDCRPLRCFISMRQELLRTSDQFEREFGVVPRIRGSLHFGPVIVGEIGDIKRAIVFNGDVMNTASRLEQLSRGVEGGFLASCTAMARFSSGPPCPVYEFGRMPIRGRADDIAVVGLEAPVKPLSQPA